ncbi:hypothetical protein Tco_0889324, partial [Tanacetum coccineum]
MVWIGADSGKNHTASAIAVFKKYPNALPKLDKKKFKYEFTGDIMETPINT